MKTIRPNRWTKSSQLPDEAGQAMIFLILALGLVLLGAVAFSVDLGNAWFRHQSAQNAADAGCTAAAMDILVDVQGGATGHQGFTNGTAFRCSPGSTASPCVYAKYNGYNSDSTGNTVDVTFPTSAVVPGLPSTSIAPTSMVPTAFVQVTVTDNMPTYFWGLLSGRRSAPVRGSAVCGVVLAASPIPLLVLDPKSPNVSPKMAAFNVQGNGTVQIVGGPTRSIQVNSAATASSCGQSNCSTNQPWGSAKIDLHQGGPNETGSDIGLYGAPTTAPTGFLPGTTGHWNAPSAPISDPYAQLCAPGQTGCPAINGNSPPAIPPAPVIPSDQLVASQPVLPCTSIPCDVAYKDHGCPDASPATRGSGKCKLYTPGHYTTNINIKNRIALFDPGLYYLDAGLTLDSNSTIRPGNGLGDGTGGVVFYFKGSGTVTVNANSGGTFDNFNSLKGPVDVGGNKYADKTTPPTLRNQTYGGGVKCTATSTVPDNLKNGGAGVNINGNILLGACSGYYGDPLGTSNPIGEQHNFLFFQDRAATSVQPSWGGNGQFLLAGNMYFHSCNASGTGVGCGAAGTYYNDVFSLGGTSGSSTYVLGNIVTDNLNLTGTAGIVMDLNPTTAYNILKATLLR